MIADPFIFTIIAGSVQRQVFPTNQRALIETFEDDSQDRRHSLKNAFSAELKFDNIQGDYNFLLSMENSAGRCRALILQIDRFCGGNYVPYKRAQIRLVDGNWDLDNCTVGIKPVVNSDYTCYDENKGKEVNLFEGPIGRVVVNHIVGGLQYHSYTSLQGTVDDPGQFGGINPNEIGWKLYKSEYFSSAVMDPPRQVFYYAREIALLGALENPGPGWVMINDNAPVNRTWARKPILINKIRLYVNNRVPEEGTAPIRFFGSTPLFSTDILGGDLYPGEWDNGIFLNDILKFYIGQYCGIQVVSNFLQLNPDSTFEATYPTLPAGITYHNIIFQKTDIKNPGATQNATKAITTIEKLINAVCTFYNLEYRIQDGIFRIEHASYFTRALTLDMTTDRNKKRITRTRKYNYDVARIPRFEIFKAMEAVHEDFVGLPIEYTGACISIDLDNVTYIAEGITTDIEAILLNSGDESKVIVNEGFAMFATTLKPDGKYYTLMETAILEGDEHLNNVLSWAFLHKYYYPWKRLQASGYINGSYRQFESSVPYKKRMRITLDFCCNDQIDLTGLVNTDMGVGQIGSAGFNLFSETLDLDLLYQDDASDLSCLRPKKFLFHSRAGNLWTFSTEFEIPGIYKTEIEAALPDNSFQSAFIDPDQDGLSSAEFFVMPGIYRFRKRIICDNDFPGPWTEYITATETNPGDPVPDCELPIAPAPTLEQYWRPGKSFHFRLPYQELKKIQVEVTIPGGLVELISGTSLFSPSLTQIRVQVPRSVVTAGVVDTVVPGTYRFRFRRICDAVSGSVSDWTNFVDVIL